MKVSRNKLNELEKVVSDGESSAEEARWAQAQEVSRRNDAGETLQDIAQSWFRARDGKSYDRSHAARCSQVWRRFGAASKRPSWTEAYAAVGYSKDVPVGEAVIRNRARITEHNERRLAATKRASAKPTTLLLWASRSIEKQVQSGRVEALWELEEALAALMEAMERARAFVFEGVAA